VSSKTKFGSIRQLPSNRFQARYNFAYRTYAAPVTFETKLDAQAWLLGERRLIEREEWSPPSERASIVAQAKKAKGRTVGDLLEAYVSRKTLAPTTRRTYAGQYKNRLEGSHICSVPVSAVTRADVTAWLATVPDDRQTWNAFTVLRGCLADAVDGGLLSANPCPRVKQRKKGVVAKPHVAHVPVVLDVAGVIAYLRAAPERYRVALAVLVLCGLRVGELRALARRNVRLGPDEGPVLLVSRQANIVHDENGRDAWVIRDALKTDASYRAVAIPAGLAARLNAWMDDAKDQRDEALVFPAADGRSVITGTTMRRPHAVAAAAIGKFGMTVHDLRKTAATLAAQQGATPAEQDAFLGHGPEGVRDIYALATAAREHERAGRLEASLKAVGGDVWWP
jgi:integrase